MVVRNISKHIIAEKNVWGCVTYENGKLTSIELEKDGKLISVINEDILTLTVVLQGLVKILGTTTREGVPDPGNCAAIKE